MSSLIETIARLWARGQAGRAVLIGGALFVLLLTFSLGVAVGARGIERAFLPLSFASGRPFGPPLVGPGHGAFGTITRIGTDSITIVDRRSGQPQTIRIAPATLIERDRHQRLRFQDLRIGDHIAVIGAPSNGVIQARFVGVRYGMPPDLDWVQ